METVSEKAPFSYDALVVLGAVMEWTPERKRWEFPTIIERYAGKLVMGKARALAAREMHTRAAKLLVTGGSDTHPETGEVASRSVELAKLITGRFEVPKEKVIPMGRNQSGHVLGNVENVVAYIKENPSMLRSHCIGVLSPSFQLERAKMLFEAEPFFREHNISLEWTAVEDVLEARSPRYSKWRTELYNTPQAEINRVMELRGIEDLRAGKYLPKT